MPKQQGFKIRIDAFLPIDKKDFAKQASTFSLMAAIQSGQPLPADFLSTVTILGVDARQGSADVPAATAPAGDPNDPANTPLTDLALPEGATVTASTTALDGSIIQNVRLGDGTETMRRISAAQAETETLAASGGAPTEMVGDKVTKRGGKQVTDEK